MIIAIGVVILVLCIVSKTMDIIVGLLGTIGGVILYAWLNSTDSLLTKFELVLEYGITPSDLQTYSIAAIVVGVVLLIVGISRGKKVQKVVVVQQQAPATNTEEKVVKKVEEKVETENKTETAE